MTASLWGTRKSERPGEVKEVRVSSHVECRQGFLRQVPWVTLKHFRRI